MSEIKQKAECGVEITYDTSAGTGSYIAFSAALAFPPALIIFDNQSDTSVAISKDGTNAWRTFPAGEGLILDLRTNAAPTADDLAFPVGTLFYGNSAAGTGNFSISYVYAS